MDQTTNSSSVLRVVQTVAIVLFLPVSLWQWAPFSIEQEKPHLTLSWRATSRCWVLKSLPQTPCALHCVSGCCFEKGSHCVALTGLELTVLARLLLRSQRSICLSSASSVLGMKGIQPNAGSPVSFNQKVLEVLTSKCVPSSVAPYSELVPLAAVICLDQTELSRDISRLL